MFLIIVLVALVLVSIALQLRLFEMIKTIPEFIAALTDRITSLESVEQSVKTLIATQNAQLTAIRAELANAGVPPDQLAALDAFLGTLDNDTAALAAAAVVQNTAAAGEAPAPPLADPEPVTIVTTELPTGDVGEAYSATVEINGGTGPYTLVSSPPSDNGITINEDGTATGTPTEAKDSSFTLTATDSLGATGIGTVTLHIDTPV